MEKYGVKKEILYEDLRNKEAELMQKIQQLLSHGDMSKTAEDRSVLEQELHGIRTKLTELDIGQG